MQLGYMQVLLITLGESLTTFTYVIKLKACLKEQR